MKTIITSIVTLLIASSISLSQPSLELVWKKNIFPTQIEFAKFSKDGNYIYCAVGNTIKKMDSKTGDFISTFDNVDSSFIYIVDRMQISNSGNFIVADNGNGAALVYDTRNERKVKQIQLGASAVTLSKDDRFLIFGSSRPESKGIVVYNLMNDTIERVINYQHNGINQIKISHDGRFFVTGSTVKNYDNTFNDQLILWDAVTMQQISVLENELNDDNFVGYRMIDISPDDKFIGTIKNQYYGPQIYSSITHDKLRGSDGRLCPIIKFLPDSIYYIAIISGINFYENETNILVYTHKQTVSSVETGKNDNNDIFVFVTNKGNGDIILFRKMLTDVEELKEIDKIRFSLNDDKLRLLEPNNIVNAKLIITDILGKIYLKQEINYLDVNQVYPLSLNLPSGIYLCKITAGNKEYTQKFEIVR